MGKHKHFKLMGFLKILDEAEIHTFSQNMGKVNSHNTGKVWGKKTSIPKFLKYFG